MLDVLFSRISKNVKLIYENQIYVIMKIKDMNLLSAKKLLHS